jgi:hypothetical protein
MDQIILSPLPLSQLLTELHRVVQVELDARQERLGIQREELLTRLEAAHLLGITLPTLRAYTTKGVVPRPLQKNRSDQLSSRDQNKWD